MQGAVRLLFDYDKWKPKVGKEIYFHQDSPYFDFIVPSEVQQSVCYVIYHL